MLSFGCQSQLCHLSVGCPGVRGLLCKTDSGACDPRGLSVLRKRAGSHPAWQLGGMPSAGLYTWMPQLPPSLLTLLPLSLGTAVSSFGLSAPLPLIPNPDLAPASPYTIKGALARRFPQSSPLFIPELLLCEVPPGLSCCHGDMILIHVFKVKRCCELLLVSLSL